MQRLLPLAFIALIAAGTTACGSGLPTSTPGSTPIALSDPTPVVSAVPGGTQATITLGEFGEADGPGGSVSEAVATAGTIGRQLVNGILLTEVDGTVWLCDALLTSSPPDCAEPRLLVVNLPQESQVDASREGHHEADGVRWQDRVQLYGDVRPSVTAAQPSPFPTSLALGQAPSSEPTEWAPPTPVCPAPQNAVQAPTVTASVGSSTIRATNGSSGFLTCSTAGSSDAAPKDPKKGVVAHPGDLMTLTLSPGWRILRWVGYDHDASGEDTNVWPTAVTPEGSGRIEVPVPPRSGDSIAGYNLSLVSADGRAVGGLDILVRVTVQ